MPAKRLRDKQFIFNASLIGLIILMFGLFAVIIYTSLFKFAETNAIEAARLSADQLLSTRSIMAKLAPHVTTDEEAGPFAAAPAVVGRAIGEELKKRHGYYIKQASERYRNPKNRPNAIEAQMLAELGRGKEETWVYDTSGEEDRIRYGKVLKIEPACLRCHGTPHVDVPDDVYTRLVSLYGDRGFNYKAGDVRGMISVIIPMASFQQESLALFYKIVVIGFGTLVALLLLLYLHNRYVIQPQIGLLRESRERLYHTAYYDQTTGMQNRFSFNQNIRDNIQNRQRSFWLLFIDLDDFKAVNDLYGHEVGDSVLHTVAERLGTIYKYAEIFRMGGDEFIMMLYGCNRGDEIRPLLQKIVDEVHKPIPIDHTVTHVGVSIGAAHYPNHATDIETLLRHGDLAMYSAKQSGKNNFVIYDSQLLARANAVKKMRHDLKKALSEGEFFLRYQPQYDVKRNRIIGAEALLRWNHPEQGVLTPESFIAVAEESGLMNDIGLWVLHEACRQNREWQVAGYAPIRVAINITAAQIEDPGFIAELTHITRKTGLDPRCLEVEFIERAAINNEGDTIEFIRELKKMGVHAAIDDFGTGYSSLSYISKFPINKIKIDRMFIEAIHEHEENALIVRSVLAIAEHLQIKVLAEGVETKEELEFLLKEGCTLVQGFYFSEPLLPEAFEERLQRQQSGA
jgi:diguanylate cyclase (GGDEF)-like protein